MEDHALDLPHTWTDEERELLSGLYPSDLASNSALPLCNSLNMSEETYVRALQLVVARSVGNEESVCMVPLFDSINHGQQGYENCAITGLEEGGSIHATDDIAEHQQLFDTFGNNAFFRLFRDYGFFSPYPRLWVFEDDSGREISFKIHETDEGYDFDFNPNNEPYQNDVNYLYNAITIHLSSVFATEPLGFKLNSSTVNANRYNTASAFRKEYIEAFQIASDHLLQLVEETEEEVDVEEEIEEEEEEEEEEIAEETEDIREEL
jgi:hypothetical protein